MSGQPSDLKSRHYLIPLLFDCPVPRNSHQKPAEPQSKSLQLHLPRMQLVLNNRFDYYAARLLC